MPQNNVDRSANFFKWPPRRSYCRICRSEFFFGAKMHVDCVTKDAESKGVPRPEIDGLITRICALELDGSREAIRNNDYETSDN